MKNNKQPELRFPGFTEDWEQRELGEVVKITMGQSPSGKNYTENPTDHILVQGNADMKKGKVIPRVWTTQITKTAEPNDIILSVRAPVGDIGKTDYNVVLGRGVAGIKGNDFIYQTLVKMKETGFWTRYSTGSTFESINSTDLKEAVISIPNEKEQQKVGNFFKQLDETIALHQQELTTLKETKQSFLQKMFPKEGEKVPEIRFPGFTDDWELRMLKDLAIYIRGSFPQPYTNPDFYDEENGKPFVQVADIGFDLKLNPDTKAHISKLAEPKSRFVKAGKVIVALQGSIEKSIGRTAITQYDAYFDRTILIFQDYKVPMDKQYFAQVIKKLFEREKERAWGATISTITKEHLNDFVIGIPCIEEQQKIGSFFKQLDDTIALHQRELDLLKKTKKAFLQKMFV